MNEKIMTQLFGQYIRKHPPDKTTVFELKICKGTSLPFDSVASHQLENLLKCRTAEGLYHKIPDMAAKSGFTARKPFDSWFIIRSRAYLVIWFYHPRKPKRFYLVDIFEWQRLKGVLKRKSVTEDIIKSIEHEEFNL